MLDQIRNSEHILKQIFFFQSSTDKRLYAICQRTSLCAYINSTLTLSLRTAPENKIKNWGVLQFSVWANI